MKLTPAIRVGAGFLHFTLRCFMSDLLSMAMACFHSSSDSPIKEIKSA